MRKFFEKSVDLGYFYRGFLALSKFLKNLNFGLLIDFALGNLLGNLENFLNKFLAVRRFLQNFSHFGKLLYSWQFLKTISKAPNFFKIFPSAKISLLKRS